MPQPILKPRQKSLGSLRSSIPAPPGPILQHPCALLHGRPGAGGCQRTASRKSQPVSGFEAQTTLSPHANSHLTNCTRRRCASG